MRELRHEQILVTAVYCDLNGPCLAGRHLPILSVHSAVMDIDRLAYRALTTNLGTWVVLMNLPPAVLSS